METGLRAAQYSTFCILWRKLLPHITVMRPMTDLCWVCQQNSVALGRANNSPLEDKIEVNTDQLPQIHSTFLPLMM